MCQKLIIFAGIFFIVVSFELVVVTIIAIVLMHVRGIESQPPKAIREILPNLEALIFCRRRLINSSLRKGKISREAKSEIENRQQNPDGNIEDENMKLEMFGKKPAENAGNDWVRVVDVADRLLFYVFLTFCTLIVLGFPISGIIIQQRLLDA